MSDAAPFSRDSMLALACTVGRTAGWMSRRAGRGSGESLSGRVTLAADRHALGKLADGRSIALVTATNGKTTTTAMLAAALGGHVCTNRLGGNLPQGLVSALAADPAQRAALEVDEQYLGRIVEEAQPEVVVLGNLSRDQLDRVGELRRTAARWRDRLSGFPGVVVANVDDPLVSWAAEAAPRHVGVRAGLVWWEDAATCPHCAGVLERAAGPDDPIAWRCPQCGAASAPASYARTGDTLREGGQVVARLRSATPGDVNLGNAAMAAVAAHQMGPSVAVAAARIAEVRPAGGRYARIDRFGRDLRLVLAKNPSGWAAALGLLRPSAGVLVAVNARAQDGKDVSWMWDVDIEPLRGRPVVVTGERRYDMALRLTSGHVPVIVEDSVQAAVLALPPGRVDVIANYSAFADLTRSLHAA